MFSDRLVSLADAQEHIIIMLGDFNAALGSDYYCDVHPVCCDRDVLLADVGMLPQSTFTHVKHGCLSFSQLDHVAMSPCLYNDTDECTVL